MVETMTYVGFDVHARSTHAAAIDVASGELRRARFGGDGLYRAAAAAGLQLGVIAPSKTPRAPGDRVKTDRKDAELLARLLLAGQLTPVAVPPPSSAARELACFCSAAAVAD